MNQDFYRRHAGKILMVAAGFIPVLAWGAFRAYDRSNNQVDQWLPRDSEATALYDDFLRAFGSDEFVLVSWEGCTLTDPRLEEFALHLEGKGEADAATAMFAEVVTGRRAYDALLAAPLRLTRSQALRRLEGTLVGRDGRTTCAVVTLSDVGDADRSAALEAIQRIAAEHGVAADDQRLGGDATIGAAIDVESQRAVNQWILVPSMALALLIAWACLRNVRLALMVFLLSEYCYALSEAVIYFTGGTMNLLLVIVPVLTYVLTISASVHLCNYYRDAIGEGGVRGAPMRAIRAGWQPCLLAAVTTSLGVVSLCVSHVMPVKMFGLYAAVSVLLSFGVTFLVLPAAMEKFSVGKTDRRTRIARRSTSRQTTDVTGRLADFVISRHATVVATCLIGAAILAGGVARIKSSVDPARFLAPESRWLSDADWFRRNVGPMAPIEVVVGFHPDCQVRFTRRMQLVRDVREQVQSLAGVRGATSAATFAPLPGATSSGRVRPRDLMRRILFNGKLLGHRSWYVEQRYIADDAGWELWRVSARVDKLDGSNYEDVLSRVRTCVDVPIAASGIPGDQLKVFCTGAVPLVLSAQEELLESLAMSFALACVLIALVMVYVLRSPSAGLITMLPNIFPALVIFGLMGWRGSLVDVGAMMTASVALGIAVDDTLHFVTWFCRALRRGDSQQEAIRHAYRKCAVAMTSTTLIAGLSLLVFFFSPFQPVSRFGLLMFLLLLAALVGDLLLLPGILATRLGKRFGRPVSSTDSASSTHAPVSTESRRWTW